MFYLTVLPNSYSLLNGKNLNSSLEPILRILYAKKTDPTEFVHFHFSNDEVSIIVPTKYVDYFTNKYCTEPYKALRVEMENPGLEEPGILADITALFKKYNIPILSTSTYCYNYIFVPITDSKTIEIMISENKEKLELEIMDV